MNSYDRVTTALAGGQPDRVPIFTYLCGESGNISDGLKRFVLANTDVFYTRRIPAGFQCTGRDPVVTKRPLDDGWVEVTHDVLGEKFTEITKPGDRGDYVGYRKHLLGDPSDIERLMRIPSIGAYENPRLDEWIAEVNEAAWGFHAAGAFTRIVIYGPIYLLGMVTSPMDLSIWTVECRDLLRQYMDHSRSQGLAYLERALREVDAPIVFNIAGAEYALPPLMSPKDFDEFVCPYERAIMDLIHSHGRLVYYHSHGKVRQFISRFVDMGVDGLHPLEPVGATGDCDISEVKGAFGRNLCLVGNIQYDDLVRLSGDALRDLVRETVLAAKPGGGFILSPSCTPFHNPMPAEIEENIVRYVEAGLEFGGYE